MRPLIILGTGLAGYTLAREFRKLDAERPLWLITQDDGRSYSKPMLSNGLSKGKSADDLGMATAEAMAAQLNATIRTDVQVFAIDRAQRTITVGSEVVEYGDLVLAIGAAVFRPPLEGDGDDKVFSVNDLEDYARFRAALGEQGRRVLIIGGGLIGCEFANDLAASGYQVELVEPMGRPLPTLLPERASEAVASGLRSLGVNFHFAGVTAVNLAGDGVRATLSDGSTVDADLVLSAIGLVALLALNILKGFDFQERDTLLTHHRQIEAIKLAFADGLAHIADPAHMRVSVADLLRNVPASHWVRFFIACLQHFFSTRYATNLI